MTAPSKPAAQTGSALVETAIAAAKMSARSFARKVLDVDERTVRRYLSGDIEPLGPTRAICLAVIERPSIARHLAKCLAVANGDA